MKVYTLTGEQHPTDTGYVEVKNNLGQRLWAKWPMQGFSPNSAWLEKNGPMQALCGFDAGDVQMSRPLIVALIPEKGDFSTPLTRQLTYFLGGTISITEDSITITYGEAKATITSKGVIEIGPNAEKAVLGEKTQKILADINTISQDMQEVNMVQDTAIAALCSALGIPYTSQGPKLTSIANSLVDLKASIEKVLSEKFKFD